MSITSGPPPTPPQLLWLRRLLDDLGSVELERALASGSQVEFFVRSPPLSAATPPRVQVNGVNQALGTDFSLGPELDSIVFTNPPAANATVLIRYTRQTWTDDELDAYLVAAGGEYVADRHIVYQAAVYAVDTLLTGTATAFDFGEGQENFAFSAVFSRLMQLKQGWETWLEDNAQQGQLVVIDMDFDSLQPGDIDDDPAQGIYGVPGGVFPEAPSYGGLSG